MILNTYLIFDGIKFRSGHKSNKNSYLFLYIEDTISFNFMSKNMTRYNKLSHSALTVVRSNALTMVRLVDVM